MKNTTNLISLNKHAYKLLGYDVTREPRLTSDERYHISTNYDITIVFYNKSIITNVFGINHISINPSIKRNLDSYSTHFNLVYNRPLRNTNNIIKLNNEPGDRYVLICSAYKVHDTGYALYFPHTEIRASYNILDKFLTTYLGKSLKSMKPYECHVID